MNIHEYQAKALFEKYGVPVPKGAPATTHEEFVKSAQELLDQGINVWTTVNIQHLESLNDLVAQITGVRQRETIPDRIFDEADEIELIDLPPEDLIARLKAGKVYVPEQAATAIERFFRKPNLIALRELALRRVTMKYAHSPVRSGRYTHRSTSTKLSSSWDSTP